MSVRKGELLGFKTRIFRISFSGEMTYEISARPDLKQAEVRLHSDFGRDSFLARVGKVNPDKAEEVSAVLKRAEDFERWFAQHHRLLAANQP